MLPAATTAGISVMCDIPWGTHFCYFYETKQDLIESSIPFFQAGLENNEFCLWIIYTPITQSDALHALRQSIPALDRYLAEGRMEIYVHSHASCDSSSSQAQEYVHYLDQKLEEALAQGYAGMRVAGSPACLQKANTDHFHEFERELGASAANRRFIALCQFPLAESSAAEILDAARTHEFVIARRHGDWEIIEPPEIRHAKAEITKLNMELECRVEERTRALEAANEELRMEIARREQIEEDLRRQKEVLETIFEHVPLSINFLDPNGRVQMANREWERLVGYTLEEITENGIDIIAEAYPDSRDRQRAIEFTGNPTAKWEDFETRSKDGQILHTTFAMVRLSDGSSIGIGQDITKRKEAEQQLRKQKEMLQTIVDRIPVMINFYDANFVLQLANREWERTLGWSLEEILRGQVDILKENYPDPAQRERARDFALHSNGEWMDFQTTVRDGRVIDTSWIMIHLPDGTSMGIGQDITARKRDEQALRESEERFRQLAENINDLFWIKTPDFQRVLYLSPVYEKMSGRSAQERYQDVDSQPFLDRIVPEDREKMAEIIRKGAQEEFDIEFRIVHPDGSIHWIHDRGFPVRDQYGQIYRVAGIARDITERKMAEQSLRESEERFCQITENIREVFWLMSHDFTQVLYLSPSYEQLFGTPREERLRNGGRNFFLDLVFPDDRPIVTEVVKSPDQEFDIEYRIVRPDHSTRWVRDRGFPIRDKSGVICSFGGVAEDITDRKIAEDFFKANSEQLRALSASLQSAREAEAARIAHQIHDEMGGILTALRWELETLQKMVDEPANTAALRIAMRDKLATMLGLTDTTIHVVRNIASDLRPSILDDLGLLEAIEWQAGQFQARTGIQCQCDFSSQPIPLGNEQATALFRIVQEALTNILRHAQATRVDITMKSENGTFVLAVSDNGRGITETEKLNRNSLGLLGMQERAHLIGGQVDIIGEKDRGTTLHVRVPITSAALGGAN